MSEDILAGDLPADESAAAAEVEASSDDADAAAAEEHDLALSIAAVGDEEDEEADYEEIAALLAGALISGSAQAADAAIARFEATGSQPLFGGPLKAALPESEEAPGEEAEVESDLA